LGLGTGIADLNLKDYWYLAQKRITLAMADSNRTYRLSAVP